MDKERLFELLTASWEQSGLLRSEPEATPPTPSEVEEPTPKPAPPQIMPISLEEAMMGHDDWKGL